MIPDDDMNTEPTHDRRLRRIHTADHDRGRYHVVMKDPGQITTGDGMVMQLRKPDAHEPAARRRALTGWRDSVFSRTFTCASRRRKVGHDSRSGISQENRARREPGQIDGCKRLNAEVGSTGRADRKPSPLDLTLRLEDADLPAQIETAGSGRPP